jgi:phenylpropionate dioxygenase-like ring-hydroxylating dioxygenase large terminal subunit
MSTSTRLVERRAGTEPAQRASEMTSDASARFLRNTWYVAAWSQDVVPGEIFARRILGEALVLFRDADGVVTALADYCPHRFAPLHLGKLLSDGRLRCGYHGLEFDAHGACVRNPHGNGVIPPAATVPAYPVAEKHGIVWIWMGTRAADTAVIPDFSIFDDAGDRLGRHDHIIFDANIDFVTTNLLDLSHVSFLHDGILGNEETIAADIDVRQEGMTLFVSREQRNVPIPLLYRLTHKPGVERGDLWRVMRWDAPGCMMLDAGTTDPGDSREDGSGYYGIHLLTPETATTTHYHFSSVRRRSSVAETQDEAVKAEIGRLRRLAFEGQDAPMMAAQQQTVRDLELQGRMLRPALLSVDAGPARYRRIMDQLLAAD